MTVPADRPDSRPERPLGVATRAVRAGRDATHHDDERVALEAVLADLEGGDRGLAFTSGPAAAVAVLDLLAAGDKVLASADLSAPTYRLFEGVRKRVAGLSFDYVDMGDPAAVEAAIVPERTKMLWVETPTDPMLGLADLAAVAAVAKRHELISVCDNTLCSPWVQRPLGHGFDIVLHLSAIYLDGDPDAACGAAVVAAGRDFVRDKLAFLRMAGGTAATPAESGRVLRALRTLPVRMARHCDTAEAVAGFLAGHPKVERVIHPALASHPQHALATRQMRRGGGMVTALLAADAAAARRLIERCRLFELDQVLGGVVSRIEHPASMSHADIPAPVRAALGIADGLVRLSVGLEDADDLIADLDQALA